MKLILQLIKQNKVSEIRSYLKKFPETLDNDELLGRAVRHGNLKIVKLLYGMGAHQVQKALGSFIYHNHREIAEYLISKGASMNDRDDYGLPILGACEVLNSESMQTCIDLSNEGFEDCVLKQCMAMLLSTYARNPNEKHACMKKLEKLGFQTPNSLVMSFHKGDLDDIKKRISASPELRDKRFLEEDIYPPNLGIRKGDGLHLTPLNGASLLHMAVEYDELGLMHYLLHSGMDANIKTELDKNGYGGQTPIFHTVVSYSFHNSAKAEILLKHGANPNIKARFRKELRYMGDSKLEKMRIFDQVTPLQYSKQFQVPNWVSHASVDLLKEYGGE